MYKSLKNEVRFANVGTWSSWHVCVCAGSRMEGNGKVWKWGGGRQVTLREIASWKAECMVVRNTKGRGVSPACLRCPSEAFDE